LRLGRDFVSRSEAGRILQGMDAFPRIIVDCQSIADEVFQA
jgi:hypothetical protein